MEEVNNSDDIAVGEEILYKLRNKVWFGKYNGEINGKHSFNLRNCKDGDIVNDHTVNMGFFDENDGWTVFKLTEKEIKEYKLKLVIVML